MAVTGNSSIPVILGNLQFKKKRKCFQKQAEDIQKCETSEIYYNHDKMNENPFQQK